MADESTRRVRASFDTRDAAERAVEHLVQEHGVHRADIFVQPEQGSNTSGTRPSGGDAEPDPAEGSAREPALRGRIEVSAEIGEGMVEIVRRTFTDLGARDVATT